MAQHGASFIAIMIIVSVPG